MTTLKWTALVLRYKLFRVEGWVSDQAFLFRISNRNISNRV